MNAPSSTRRTALLGAVMSGVALVAAACGGSGTGPVRGSLSADESRALATTMDSENNTVVGDQTGRLDTSPGLARLSDGSGHMPGLRATVLSSETTFHTQRDCRLGGNLTVDGHISHTFDTDTHTLTADFQATATHDACVRKIRTTNLTLTGNPNLQLVAHRERVNGAPSGLQTWSLQGSVDWVKSDGTSGTCDIDIQGQLDPAARARTIDGSVCGHTVHESLTWDGANA
ncbi:MAG: hypothetical protein Q8W49_06630 [Candidatus Palauibacterales bacterium]|nr:hypothetical protein [Candidatus Palauibacterales bacterium]